jgi:hypothetical protein
MPVVKTILKYLMVPALAMGSALARATTSATFSFTPLPPAAVSPAAVSPAAETAPMAVPLLGDVALLALGVLLIVVALRTLQANKGIQKLFSVALLGAGLVLGGIGGERASALVASGFVIGENPSDLECAGVTDQSFPLYHNDTAIVTNNCQVPGEVTTVYQGAQNCSLSGGDCGTLEVGATCTLPDEVCLQ